MQNNKVFVYGTLRPKDRNGNYLPATHAIAGWKMYNYYGRFPYIEKADLGDEKVYGNMLHVGDDELMQLDAYEGVDRGLYTRENVVVGDMEDNESVAFVYVASGIAPQRIESGDWADSSRGGARGV